MAGREEQGRGMRERRVGGRKRRKKKNSLTPLYVAYSILGEKVEK